MTRPFPNEGEGIVIPTFREHLYGTEIVTSCSRDRAITTPEKRPLERTAALITSSTALTIRYMSMDACQSFIVVLSPGSRESLFASSPASRPARCQRLLF